MKKLFLSLAVLSAMFIVSCKKADIKVVNETTDSVAVVDTVQVDSTVTVKVDTIKK